MKSSENLAGQRLILHVGMGKTGTTSIQDTLRAQQEKLSTQCHRYFGLIFEYAPIKQFAWQSRAHAAQPLAKKNERTVRLSEINEILTASLYHMKERGEHTAIWSNEALFDAPDEFIHLIQNVQAMGVEVDIVFYLRRPDKWAHSAYLQWGMKHKTYTGPLLSFREYFSLRPINFYEQITRWMIAFPQQIIMRNFDATDDVVKDFMKILKLENTLDVATKRENESPSNEELLFRSIFNNGFESNVLPDLFNRTMHAENVDFRLDINDWFGSLLPDDKDLADILDDTRSDIENVNELLQKQGQPTFTASDFHPRSKTIDRNRLIDILIQIVTHQARQIHSLRTKVDYLYHDNDKDKG